MISKHTRRRLGNCLKAGLAGAVLTTIPGPSEKYIEFYYPIIGFLSGALTGVLELFIFREKLRKMNIILALLIKSISYSAAIYVMVLFFMLLLYAVTGISSLQDQIGYILNDEFNVVIIKSYKASILFISLFQLDDLLGDGTFRKYVTGKYHQPRQQDMIFMFLDIKSSTSLAEQLGDIQYYQLINDFFYDISSPIIETDAEIYKYVGDEVIICWTREKGLKHNNCVNLYFGIKQKLEKKTDFYLQKYGLVPEYKAGMHIGTVVCAQIGDIRKEIVYNGDVLNTASRLEEICNEYNAMLLISEQLKNQLTLEKDYALENLGEIQLKGKSSAMEVYSVKEKQKK